MIEGLKLRVLNDGFIDKSVKNDNCKGTTR